MKRKRSRSLGEQRQDLARRTLSLRIVREFIREWQHEYDNGYYTVFTADALSVARTLLKRVNR